PKRRHLQKPVRLPPPPAPPHPLSFASHRPPFLAGSPKLLGPGLENVVRAATKCNQCLARLTQALVFRQFMQSPKTTFYRCRRRREALAERLDQGRIIDTCRLGQ